MALGWSDGTRNSMRLPGVGLYRWSDEDREVTATPEAGTERDTIVDAFHRCVLPMVLQAEGREVLHGSAVLLPRGAVALCARSRTGKSTLAFGLSRQLDCPLWADDAVAVELTAEGASALPLPFSLKLRHPAARYFGTDSRAVGGPEDPDPPAHSAPLLAVFTLTRSDVPGRSARASRTTAGRAFTALLEHAYCFDLNDRARRRRMVDQYLELSARVPVFELCFPSDLEALPATLGEIIRTLDHGRC